MGLCQESLFSPIHGLVDTLAVRAYRVLGEVPARAPLLTTKSDDFNPLEHRLLDVSFPCIVREEVVIAARSVDFYIAIYNGIFKSIHDLFLSAI